MSDPNHQASLTDASIDQLSYEEAFNELESIVAALEGEELTLEKAIALYERGQNLIHRCTSLLDKADLRVQQLSGENLVDFEP